MASISSCLFGPWVIFFALDAEDNTDLLVADSLLLEKILKIFPK